MTTMNAGEEPTRNSLDKYAWRSLLGLIAAGRCTPFLGAGLGHPYLPLGADVAKQLADDFDYPFQDRTNLPRVSQYIASVVGPAIVRTEVKERIQGALDVAEEELQGRIPENYRTVARLTSPLIITTNYDDLIERALKAEGKVPQRVVCRWHATLLEDLPAYPLERPSIDRPYVFYLHGVLDTEDSILVTEDDYVTFLANLAITPNREDLLWHRVRRALASSLLFIGYSLEDWNFRVLLKYVMTQQKITSAQRDPSLSIQLPPRGLDDQQKRNAQKFLEKYLSVSSVRVHWTDAQVFLEELHRRWEMMGDEGA